MTNPQLSEVGARLDKAVQELVDKGLASIDLYDTYEMVAIAELDAFWNDFEPEELEQFLKAYLETKKQ